MPFIETLEFTARTVSPATFRQLLGDAAPEVARLMPELRRMFADIPPPLELPPEQQRRFLFNAYRDFIERSCRLTPLAIVFEDLQWADEPTLLLLQHVAQRSASLPILIIGTYRDVALDMPNPFTKMLETWLRQRVASRLTLRRLSQPAVETMLSAMSGQSPPSSFTRLVFEETEGNPFFVEEVFQHLAEEGKLFDAQGAWRPDLHVEHLEVPESVRLVLGRRLERLDHATRRVLTAAATVGRSFSLRVLEQLEPQPDVVLEAIEEAEQAHVVAPERAGREPRYRFVHELIRQTLTEALSLPRRQRLHARIAEAIEHVYAESLEKHVPAVAHHLYQTGPSADCAKTTKYLLMAAQQSRATAAHEEALAHLDKTLLLWEGHRTGEVAELHAQRAAVLSSLGRSEDAVETYERAIALRDAIGDPVNVALTSLPLCFIHAWKADAPRGLAVTERALDRLGEAAPGLRCRLLFVTALIYTVAGEPETALGVWTQAKELQRLLDDRSLDGFADRIEAHLYLQTMQLDLGAEASRRAIASAVSTGDLWDQVGSEYVPICALLYGGRPAEAERLIGEALPRAERIGYRDVIWTYKNLLTDLCIARGDLLAAEHAAQESRVFGEAFGVTYRFLDELVLGDIMLYRGRPEEALQHFRAARDLEPRSLFSGLSHAMLFYALAHERHPDALQVLHERPLRLVSTSTLNPVGAWAGLYSSPRGSRYWINSRRRPHSTR